MPETDIDLFLTLGEAVTEFLYLVAFLLYFGGSIKEYIGDRRPRCVRCGSTEVITRSEATLSKDGRFEYKKVRKCGGGFLSHEEILEYRLIAKVGVMRRLMEQTKSFIRISLCLLRKNITSIINIVVATIRRPHTEPLNHPQENT